MKAAEFLAEDGPVKVRRFPMYYGRRPASFKKLYWDPFIKELTVALRPLKGKWDGEGYSGYIFPNDEKAAAGKEIIDAFAIRWAEIEKLVPEGSADIGAAIADDYFKRNAASKNPNSQ